MGGLVQPSISRQKWEFVSTGVTRTTSKYRVETGVKRSFLGPWGDAVYYYEFVIKKLHPFSQIVILSMLQ